MNPRVNALVSLDADRAREAALAADEAVAHGEPAGMLHGLPFAFKDTHEVAGWRTTYGSPVHADHVPDEDELLVERIRAAGVVVVGRTNVPEFAAGSHTFNPVFGTTLNPYDLSRSAGGSSGGAAAALASGMVPLADGSDMGGSLRNPASFCNVVGLRPSLGRVPLWPTRNAWETTSVAGPMARDVADLALLLSVIAGPDPRVLPGPLRVGVGLLAARRGAAPGPAGRAVARPRRRLRRRPGGRSRGRVRGPGVHRARRVGRRRRTPRCRRRRTPSAPCAPGTSRPSSGTCSPRTPTRSSSRWPTTSAPGSR